jgi:hypothetical protein
VRTEYDGYFSVWFRERVGCTMTGTDDDGAVHGGTVHGGVRMPPQGAFLLREDDSVGEIVAGLDWTLCYVLWPIPPWASWLIHAMPAHPWLMV